MIAKDKTLDELMRENAELRQSSATLSALMEHTDDRLLICDRDAMPVAFNTAFARTIKKATGVDMKPGMQPHKLLPDPEQVAWWDGLHRRVLSGESFRVDIPSELVEKRGRHFDVSFTPIMVDGEVTGFTEVARDITDRKTAEARHETLSAISELFLSSENLDHTYCELATLLRARLGFPIASVEVYDERAGEMVFVGAAGMPTEQGRPMRVPVGKTVSGTVVRTNKAVIELNASRRPEDQYEGLRALGIETFVCVPMRHGDRVLGIVSVADRAERTDAVAVADILQVIANRLAQEIVHKRAEKRYRSLFENLKDAVMAIDSETGMIVDANAQAEALWGRPKEELIGMHQTLLHPPEDKERHQKGFMEAVAGGGREDHETEIITKAGDIVSVSISAQLVDLEELSCILATFRDITDRKWAEEEIEALARFPSDNPNPVLRISMNGTLLHANPASRSLLEEWQIGEGDRVSEDVAQWVAKSYGNGGSLEMETVASDKVYSFVLATVEGQDYVNLYGRDITEHKRLEEQLRQTQKMEAIGLLAGGIAHDFNNLLQGILGYAGLLKMRFPKDEKVFKAADVIARAGTRAAELTQQLLGFARKGKLRNTPVDIHRSVGETVAILTRTVDKRITMVQRLGAKPCIIKGDPGQLQQVIMNLAVNARDAMPEGGTLTFETSLLDHAEESGKLPMDMSQGQYLHLSMSDTGVGMTPEVRERIFEPFYTTKPQGEGTGMGLAMVYGIVKNHGGSVVVNSTPGKGTTFDIYLPLAGRSARITDTQKLKSLPRGSGRILVVDDEETVRAIVTEMLTMLGYQVSCACDGREAVEHYRDHADETDLVLLDMTMPVVDGLQCFKELKKLDPNVKAVIATGHALDGVAQETLDAGALRFIHKPFMIAELAETLNKAMAN